ncbi:MAG TPA: hypothetical protein VJZ16_05275 [Syntrophales bacterium]|nr:hypothetical protein [Syntrophales bacterium]
MEDDYREIIDIIKRDTAVSPPDDFTETVMARISRAASKAGHESGLFSFLKDFLAGFEAVPAGSITIRECSFYFSLIGVFYLVLGAVLLAGFTGNTIMKTTWLRWQPELILILAIMFLFLGYNLRRKGEAALKAVKNGIIFYLCLVVINGMSLQLSLKPPLFLNMAFIFLSSLFGVILALALHNTFGDKVYL